MCESFKLKEVCNAKKFIIYRDNELSKETFSSRARDILTLKPCHAKQRFYGSVLCSLVCAITQKLVLRPVPEGEVTKAPVNGSLGVDKSGRTLE